MEEEIIKQLKELPELIAKGEQVVFDTKRSLDVIDEGITEIESVIFIRVVEEKNDETGKPHFTNDTIRKTETTNRCSNDKGFIDLKLKQLEEKEKLMRSVIELDRLKNTFSSLKYITRLLTRGDD